MGKKKKDADQQADAAKKAEEQAEQQAEEGYGSVDEEEKKTIDKKEVISNPG